MQLEVVPAYAALLALLFIALSVRVIRVRRAGQVAIGTGGNAEVERRARVQGNFAEYVPFALLLLAMAELRGIAPVWLHVGGVVLLLGRLSHAWGVSRTPGDYRFRVAGMGATFAVLSFGAVRLLLPTS